MRWKYIPHEYLGDRVILAASHCVEQHHFVCKPPVGSVSPNRFRSEFSSHYSVAAAVVVVVFLHRFRSEFCWLYILKQFVFDVPSPQWF